VGQIFNKSVFPISLILVITGMLLSLWPGVFVVSLNPRLVLDIFLPLLVYQISVYSSWKDFKKNIRPILLLSVGHVVFITIIIAVAVHFLIPEFGWPLAFIVGAVLAPPDTVAIVSIAEKIRMPNRIITILEGEGLLNDATALTLFRFALAALLTHQFSPLDAFFTFLLIIIGETLYGLALGFAVAELRLRIINPMLHIMASLITPFLAFLPAVWLGGSGIIATVVVGFVISHTYSARFNSEFRLLSHALWPAIAFALQGILFLLVGLNFKTIFNSILPLSLEKLFLHSIIIILIIILGRFFWIYTVVFFLPRYVFPGISKKEPHVPWQFPLVLSWAGMRGGISLAAALAVPILPGSITGVNPRSLLIFLVFIVIAATFLLQGLTLPLLLKKINIKKYNVPENFDEHVAELAARKIMTQAVLEWLFSYQNTILNNKKLFYHVKLQVKKYEHQFSHLQEQINHHNVDILLHDDTAEEKELLIYSQIISIEKKEIIQLYHSEKITFKIREKLLTELDHRSNQLTQI
jgi:CPA1 family monovalent cation:H+ antiporter